MSLQSSISARLTGGTTLNAASSSVGGTETGSLVVGYQSGAFNTGEGNAFMGFKAALNSKTGSSNVVIGGMAAPDLGGDLNTVVGAEAGAALASGRANVELGAGAGRALRGGLSNTLVGPLSDTTSPDGVGNVVLGASARGGLSRSVCIGADAGAWGSSSVVIGAMSKATGVGSVVIGPGLVSTDSNNALNLADRLHGGWDASGSKYVLRARADALVVEGTATVKRGLQLARPNGDPWWRFSVAERSAGSADLVLRSAGDARVTFTDDFHAGLFDFTAQHRCVWGDPELPALPPPGSEARAALVGRLVVSTGAYPQGVLVGSAVPSVRLARDAFDARVFGVVAGFEDEDPAFRLGNLAFTQQPQPQPQPQPQQPRVIVNAAGEGALWVCDAGGPVRNGDLVVASPVPGLAMRQPDDVVRASTVGKTTADCDFQASPPWPGARVAWGEQGGTAYRAVLLGCVYRL